MGVPLNTYKPMTWYDTSLLFFTVRACDGLLFNCWFGQLMWMFITTLKIDDDENGFSVG